MLTCMDVSSLSTGMQIEAALLAKAKNQAEVRGEAALKLIDAATQSAPRVPVEPHRGRHINVRA